MPQHEQRTMKQFKVKFTARGGCEYERKSAIVNLELGKEYTVKKVKVAGWFTEIQLVGEIDKWWNSALFDDNDDLNQLMRTVIGVYSLEK